MAPLVDGFVQIMAPWPLFLLFIGVAMGILVGAIPGLTGAMLIALMLPISFFMQPFDAVVLFVAIYTGSISGGLITATLLQMPGSPANILTTFDGYPMAKSGRPGRAIGLGVAASTIGGLFSAVFLVTVTKPLSIFATRLGPFEYFSLVMMAMVLIASVNSDSLVKGLIAGFLGMVVSMPGVDPSSGMPRLTWDYTFLNGGLKLFPVLVGIFAVGQVFTYCLKINEKGVATEVNEEGLFMSVADLKRHAGNLIRSSFIGTWIGILPGIGASIGSIVAYTTQKSISRHPQAFGKGSEEGIIASEAANNATVGGALIPLLAMGIPGSVVDALLIAALMIHSIIPGPTLFITHGDIVYGMMAAYILSTLVMYVLMIGTLRWLAMVIYLPRSFVLPVVATFCIIGGYAAGNTIQDVWVMLLFGVVGFMMIQSGFPRGPFVIGFILAPIAESKLRSGLMMTGGDFTPLFTRPISAFLLVLSIALLVMPFLMKRRKKREDPRIEAELNDV